MQTPFPAPRRAFGILGKLALLSTFTAIAAAQCSNGTVSVLTGQYDNFRDSVNSNETCLTPQPATFYAAGGTTPVFVQKADFPITLSAGGQSPVFGQPLYLQNVPIAGGTHNVIYVTGLNNVIYAYDADNYGTGSPPAGVLYWSAHVTSNCDETVDGVSYPGTVVVTSNPKVPYLGIVSTPVIDPAAGVIYAVNACNVTGPTNPGMQWFLNALNLATGALAAPPVRIAGGVTNSFGSTAFTPIWEIQRSALLLSPGNGAGKVVYIAFAAGTTEDATENPYHGWIFGYSLSAHQLLQESVFTTTPAANVYSTMCDAVVTGGYPLPPNWCGQGGGIWMSGRGPAANTLNGVNYFFAGVSDGGFQTAAPENWGESVLKFAAGAAAAPIQSFTSSGWYLDENENDEDLATSGIVLFDGLVNGTAEHFLVTTDKAGNLFLLSQNQLSGFNSPDQALQEFLASSSTPCQQTNVGDSYCNEPHSLVFWNDTLYMWPSLSPLRAFTFSNGRFVEQVALGGAAEGYPGGMLALSSNGTTNGILWATHSPSSRTLRKPGTLAAFDPLTLRPMWASTDAFQLSTFGEVTVVNGRVYLPTWDHGLLVYANH